MVILCAGSWVADFVAAHLPNIPDPGGLVYAPGGISLRVGGHSANVAVDLSQLGELFIHSIGCIGGDILGNYIEETLRLNGIAPHPQRIQEKETAKNLALIVDREDRRFISELAANTELSSSHVESIIEKVQPTIFYLGTVGGLKYVDFELKHVLKAARDNGATIIVDVIMPTNGWRHLTSAYPYIDILHCNGLEATSITGFTDSRKAAKQLTAAGVGVSVVTLGSHGLFAHNGADLLEMPAFSVTEVDSTGAGDALCAGIISALSRSGSKFPSMEQIRDILLFASAAGAACVTSIGATTSVTKANVEKLILEQGESMTQKIKIY